MTHEFNVEVTGARLPIRAQSAMLPARPVHRRVGRRYLARRAASRATPTITSTMANMTMAAMVSMAIAFRSGLCGARFGDAEPQCQN